VTRIENGDAAKERNLSGIFLTRAQLEEWAGRPLADAEVEHLGKCCIPHSGVPVSVREIVSTWGLAFAFLDAAGCEPDRYTLDWDEARDVATEKGWAITALDEIVADFRAGVTAATGAP
jgi:hypothetical protein